MLDENLPTFFLKGSPNGVKHHEAYYYSQHGSEPEPTYTLKHPDPSMPDGKNVYAAGLFDAFNPEVLYGEVYIKPEWTYPTLSQEEIRKNGGVPPPPQPVLPTEFTIQLYDPDQQVVVKQKSGSWGGTASYEFSMPQNTFRLPSASSLDRSLNDPAADITTPKINFVWKREGKLSKDLSCFMTGKSTDPAKKKRKMKEPDIAVALFRALREVTVYESNLYRVEMEDPKGLEIVLLLAAATIKALYFGQVNETFNTQYDEKPPLDPRAQWEIDAEHSRLKLAQAAEAREQRRAQENKQRERQRSDEAEQRRLRKIVEAEDKQRRKKAAEVDKETERLRRKNAEAG
ncbi:hypothetical protein GTA08_BOTSDO13808 [Neofusicoccum parvum]|uniref:Uncharacterized protein n=2 Tax=Neofusicoccum parvum TaxID=310453 RepID=R1ETN8_BOTPV|nr:hypothetical protein UCRNP2_2048 [Neofusicoccum parvum UCRNP2]GME23682.1 hypothetical protein GTA08_BOTSDO13808 [Neofusicoccum parvum]GME56198.1 hypothetical protein GTA08_BOTSDO13808 [Neofusicoccum parvum]